MSSGVSCNYPKTRGGRERRREGEEKGEGEKPLKTQNSIEKMKRDVLKDKHPVSLFSLSITSFYIIVESYFAINIYFNNF